LDEMMKAASIGVVCAALVLAAVAGARGAAQTNVTIKGAGGDFAGKVKSSKAACFGDRKVIVYRLKGNGYDPANDTRVGSDVSSVRGDHGVWAVGNTGFKHGAFYAFAPRIHGCKPGFSLPIQL
jgi:hypothetical protein